MHLREVVCRVQLSAESPLLALLHSWLGPESGAHQQRMIPLWNDTCLSGQHGNPAAAPNTAMIICLGMASSSRSVTFHTGVDDDSMVVQANLRLGK